MTKDITSENWEGDWADPIEPSRIQFTAITAPQAGECTGCLFRTQRAAVCNKAAVIAEALELPLCSPRFGPTYIYVRDPKTDPRQLRIKRDPGAAGEGAHS